MPYFVQGSMSKKDMVLDLDFEPAMEGRLKSRIAIGRHLSDDEIAQISRTLLLTDVPSIGLPDIIGSLNGPYVVCAELRDKIEELEPGVHRFVPLNLVGTKMERKDYGTYYLLLLTQALDAVLMEGTRFRVGYGLKAAEQCKYALYADGPCVLDSTVIGDRHLWRGAGPGDRWSDYFCSDALGDFIKERKMRGWDLLRCETK